MNKLKSKINSFSLDNSRSSKYCELNSDIQVAKSSVSLVSQPHISASSGNDSNYVAFENSDLLNDALCATLKPDIPHIFDETDSSMTVVMIMTGVIVDTAFDIICKPESYIHFSPHIVCVSFKDETIVSTSGIEIGSEIQKKKLKMDITVYQRRMFFWKRMETLDGYFLLPCDHDGSSKPKFTSAKKPNSYRSTPFSEPKTMELHTQDSNGGEMRYQYVISDHSEGTKVSCKITEERRAILKSDKLPFGMSESSSENGSMVRRARERIFRLLFRNKLRRAGLEQSAFLNYFKDHLKEMKMAPTQHIV